MIAKPSHYPQRRYYIMARPIVPVSGRRCPMPPRKSLLIVLLSLVVFAAPLIAACSAPAPASRQFSAAPAAAPAAPAVPQAKEAPAPAGPQVASADSMAAAAAAAAAISPYQAK